MRQLADPPARPCCRDQTWVSRASVRKKNKQKLNGKIILSQIAQIRFCSEKVQMFSSILNSTSGKNAPGPAETKDLNLL